MFALSGSDQRHRIGSHKYTWQTRWAQDTSTDFLLPARTKVTLPGMLSQTHLAQMPERSFSVLAFLKVFSLAGLGTLSLFRCVRVSCKVGPLHVVFVARGWVLARGPREAAILSPGTISPGQGLGHCQHQYFCFFEVI